MNKLLPLLAFLVTSAAAPAAVVAINNTLLASDSGNIHYGDSSSTVRLKDSAGALLPVGTVFRVGFFLNYTNALDSALATSSFEILTSPANPNRFVPIGVGNGSVGDDQTANMMIRDVGGTLRAITSVSNIDYLTGAPNTEVAGLTRGTKLFLFVLDQNTFAGSPEEWGVFSAETWVVPATGTANLTVAFKEVDTPGEVFRGRLGSLSTVPVPEPTASMLALGAMALGLRRRR